MSSQHKNKTLEDFCQRFSQPPFKRQRQSVALWSGLWPELTNQGREELARLAAPCFKHVESRLGKPERASHLTTGFHRLLGHDERLFCDGLQLFPHAVCRTAEAVGPLPNAKWLQLELRVKKHRLWSVPSELSEQEFWTIAERFEKYRELPQAVLDFIEYDRPREKAPISEFQSSLQKFVLRQKIEQLRRTTYELLRVHGGPGGVLETHRS